MYHRCFRIKQSQGTARSGSVCGLYKNPMVVDNRNISFLILLHTHC
uniref:Uncharacterized protein n=1 Tax=Arundo donax TaxID=35708 RepID=A0A0A9FYF7_ARUDO